MRIHLCKRDLPANARDGARRLSPCIGSSEFEKVCVFVLAHLVAHLRSGIDGEVRHHLTGTKSPASPRRDDQTSQLDQWWLRRLGARPVIAGLIPDDQGPSRKQTSGCRSLLSVTGCFNGAILAGADT